MKIFRFFAVIMLILTLSSCTPVIKTPMDEIRLNSWSASLNGRKRAELRFSEDRAVFNILNKNNKSYIKINGTAFMDGNNLVIFDENDKESYVFSLKLKENILTLGYDGGKLRLKRDTK